MHTLSEMQKSDSWRDPEEAREGMDAFMRQKLLDGWKGHEANCSVMLNSSFQQFLTHLPAMKLGIVTHNPVEK